VVKEQERVDDRPALVDRREQRVERLTHLRLLDRDALGPRFGLVHAGLLRIQAFAVPAQSCRLRDEPGR
jgi:hypothetical protein